VFSVDFDLEQGPSLSCIFPPLPLYPFEAENMFVILAIHCVPVDVELELVPSRHFLIRRYLKKVQIYIPFVFENKFRGIKWVLSSTRDGRSLRTASFTAFLILIKRKAPLPNADTLKYCCQILRVASSHLCCPEVHRGFDTPPIPSAILCPTKPIRPSLSHSW